MAILSKRPQPKKKKSLTSRPKNIEVIKVKPAHTGGNKESSRNTDGGLSFDNSREIERQRLKFADELNKNSSYGSFGDGEDITTSLPENEPETGLRGLARKATANPTKKGITFDEKTKQRNSKYRNLTFKMYSYKLFNWLLQGSLDKRDPNLNNSQMQVGYTSIITKKTFTRYYAISYLEEDTPVAFYNHVKKAFDETNFWVKVSFQINNKPFYVDFSKAGIQLKLLRWKSQIKESNEEAEENEVTTETGRSYVQDIGESNKRKFLKRMIRSFFAIRDNNKHTNEATFIIKLQTRDDVDMMIADNILTDHLVRYNADYKPITGKVLDFLRTFSIVSKQRKSSATSTPRVLLTNRDLADLTPIKQGKIGWFGIFFGIDKLSGLPIWIDLMSSSNAKNILITAITGFGKSFYLSFQLMFHKAVGNRIFIQDYKGTEFIDFTISQKGLVISQTPSKTSFINKWKIPTKGNYTDRELRGFYTDSIGLAMVEFMTIINPEQENRRKVEQVFNDFLRFVHKKAGIEPNNVSTYINSNKITPEYLYDCYLAFSGNQSQGIIEMYGKPLLLSIKNDLYNYYHKDGARHELFMHEIDMDEVLANDVICFDFGMQETTANAVPYNELKLKQLNYETVSSRYVAHNKKNKITTVKVTEEIQSADEDLLKFTAADISQGRSNNMINYILGNSSGVLFSDNRYSKTIKDGITIQVLGGMHLESREKYIQEFGLHNVADKLEQISNDKAYKRCFLVHCTMTDEPITAIAQMVTTPDIAESPYFRTVDHKGNENLGKMA